MRAKFIAMGLVVPLITGIGAARQDNGPTETVRCEIPGEIKIRSILPDGTYVKRDELVCELDDENFRDRLIEQKSAVARAETEHLKAKQALEAAEVLLEEFQKVGFREEGEAALRVARAADDDLKQTIEALFAAAEDLANTGDFADLDDPEIRRAEREVVLLVFELIKGYSIRDMLEARTQFLPTREEAKIKELKAEIEGARARMFGKESDFLKEKIEEEKLYRLILKTKFYAPFEGIITYAKPEVPEDRGIGKASIVREGQPIFHCSPASPD